MSVPNLAKMISRHVFVDLLLKQMIFFPQKREENKNFDFYVRYDPMTLQTDLIVSLFE